MSTPSTTQRNSSPPDQPTFPLEAMTGYQREIFTQFLKARRKSYLNLQEPISFARLLARDKPGMVLTSLVMPQSVAYASTITIEDVAEAFTLESIQHDNGDLYVARTSWLIELLPWREGSSDTVQCRVGCFLGYPPEDIEHYVTSDPPYTQPEELVLEGMFQPEEIAYTTYLPQTHDDSIDRYKRAIESGKRIQSVIEDCASTWNLPELAEYSDWLYEKSVAECSP